MEPQPLNTTNMHLQRMQNEMQQQTQALKAIAAALEKIATVAQFKA